MAVAEGNLQTEPGLQAGWLKFSRTCSPPRQSLGSFFAGEVRVPSAQWLCGFAFSKAAFCSAVASVWYLACQSL